MKVALARQAIDGPSSVKISSFPDSIDYVFEEEEAEEVVKERPFIVQPQTGKHLRCDDCNGTGTKPAVNYHRCTACDNGVVSGESSSGGISVGRCICRDGMVGTPARECDLCNQTGSRDYRPTALNVDLKQLCVIHRMDYTNRNDPNSNLTFLNLKDGSVVHHTGQISPIHSLHRINQENFLSVGYGTVDPGCNFDTTWTHGYKFWNAKYPQQHLWKIPKHQGSTYYNSFSRGGNVLCQKEVAKITEKKVLIDPVHWNGFRVIDLEAKKIGPCMKFPVKGQRLKGLEKVSGQSNRVILGYRKEHPKYQMSLSFGVVDLERSDKFVVESTESLTPSLGNYHTSKFEKKIALMECLTNGPNNNGNVAVCSGWGHLGYLDLRSGLWIMKDEWKNFPATKSEMSTVYSAEILKQVPHKNGCFVMLVHQHGRYNHNNVFVFDIRKGLTERLRIPLAMRGQIPGIVGHQAVPRNDLEVVGSNVLVNYGGEGWKGLGMFSLTNGDLVKAYPLKNGKEFGDFVGVKVCGSWKCLSEMEKLLRMDEEERSLFLLNDVMLGDQRKDVRVLKVKFADDKDMCLFKVLLLV